VYPEGAWYAGLEVTDAGALAQHLMDGTRIAAKLSDRPGITPEPPGSDGTSP
jgi:(2Fe-2S) ferredoxin